MNDTDTSPESAPRLTRPSPQNVANGYSIEPDIDDVWQALEGAYAQIDALSAALGKVEVERQDAMLRLSEMRMCVNCGRKTGADHNRNMPLPDCPAPDACTFDTTPDEAWQHWRQKAHDQRARAEAAESSAARLQRENDTLRSNARAQGLVDDIGATGKNRRKERAKLARVISNQRKELRRKHTALEAVARRALERAAKEATSPDTPAFHNEWTDGQCAAAISTMGSCAAAIRALDPADIVREYRKGKGNE